jgi:hypothetical protein
MAEVKWTFCEALQNAIFDIWPLILLHNNLLPRMQSGAVNGSICDPVRMAERCCELFPVAHLTFVFSLAT